MTTIWSVTADVENYASIELARDSYDQLPIFDGHCFNGGWRRDSGHLTYGKVVGDFAYLTAGMLACRLSSWDQISEEIVGEVEVLSIDIEPVPFVILNPTNVVPCLDLERSEVRYFPGSGRVYRVLKHVFYQDLLGSSHLFKVPELRTDLFSTDRFRKLVEGHKMCGLLFQSVSG